MNKVDLLLTDEKNTFYRINDLYYVTVHDYGPSSTFLPYRYGVYLIDATINNKNKYVSTNNLVDTLSKITFTQFYWSINLVDMINVTNTKYIEYCKEIVKVAIREDKINNFLINE